MKPRSILIKMDNNASFDRFGEWEESRLGPKLFFSLILGRSSRIVPCLLFTSLVQSEHKINYASRVPCASVSQDSTKVFTGMPRVVLPEPASRAIPFLSAACWGRLPGMRLAIVPCIPGSLFLHFLPGPACGHPAFLCDLVCPSNRQRA